MINSQELSIKYSSVLIEKYFNNKCFNYTYLIWNLVFAGVLNIMDFFCNKVFFSRKKDLCWLLEKLVLYCMTYFSVLYICSGCVWP